MTAQKPRMLILMFTELSREPRAMRQVREFRDDFEVVTAGIGASPFPDIVHIEIPAEIPGSFVGRAWRYAWRMFFWRMRSYARFERLRPHAKWAFDRLRKEQWDIVIAHDVQTVSVANRLRSRNGVLVDLHEYAPRQYDHSEEWVRFQAPYNSWLCSAEVSKAAQVITVGEGIAAEYERNFGFAPAVIVNATPYASLGPTEVHEPIRLVHSGIAVPARKLELMIEGVRAARDAPVTLDLLLVEPEGSTYTQELKRIAGDDPRIRILPAVPYADLVKTLNGYDVGVVFIPATTFNHEWGLPNKLFDFVQARLALMVGPSREMVRYVEHYGLGTCTASFEVEAFAEALRRLGPEEVRAYKQNSDDHAKELSGERQMESLRDIVMQMIGSGKIES